MSLSIVFTRAQLGIHAPLVTVETHLSNGLPSLTMVGLPETAVRESKERVRSALINSGFDFPTRRITINLAPADLPKQGGRYDLAIAISILIASGQMEASQAAQHEFVGELALTGELRNVPGLLPSAIASFSEDRALIAAPDNAIEAAFLETGLAYGARHLLDVCRHLSGETRLRPANPPKSTETASPAHDLSDVKGQHIPRAALEVAAAGGHNLLLYGPPGTGKSMLAKRLPGILPPLSREERVDVASLYSLTGEKWELTTRTIAPFRSPHHSASAAALVGGGSVPKPGEVSLAHHGVLFLDELPEFSRHVLEELREPIESGEIHLSRASGTLSYPARFQLIAAMNPCPCGYAGHPTIPCTDTPQQIAHYRKKLSGPLLDRFDLHVEVGCQSSGTILDHTPAESSERVFRRVQAAIARQEKRQNKRNRELSVSELKDHCALSPTLRDLLEKTLDTLNMSARSTHRILRVARTIADLDNSATLTRQHLLQAVSFRNLDRKAT